MTATVCINGLKGKLARVNVPLEFALKFISIEMTYCGNHNNRNTYLISDGSAND